MKSGFRAMMLGVPFMFWALPLVTSATTPVRDGLTHGTIIFEPSYEELARVSIGLWINITASLLFIVLNGWYAGAFLSWLRARKKFLSRRSTFWFWFGFFLLLLAYYFGLSGLFSLFGQTVTTVIVLAGFAMIFFAPPVVAFTSLLIGKIRKRIFTKSRRLILIGALTQLSVFLSYTLIAYFWWPK